MARPNLTGIVIATALLGWMAAASAGPKTHASVGIKCWVNHDGVKECGNAVPAEYAQEEHEVKNKNGMTVKTTEKAKTLEEVTAESAERRAHAAEEAAAAAAAKRQADNDKVLLATFSSEDDLMMARDGQFENVESQIKITESHIAKLNRSLDQMIAKAAATEKQGKKVSKELQSGIENTRKQIEEQEHFIDSKHAEKEAIRAKFDADLVRFRELRSGAR